MTKVLKSRLSVTLLGCLALLLAGCGNSPESMCKQAADKVAELKIEESVGKNASPTLISRTADSLKNNSSLMKQCAAEANDQRFKCVMRSDSLFQARTACDWKWVQYTGS